jgi:hypothetical protein
MKVTINYFGPIKIPELMKFICPVTECCYDGKSELPHIDPEIDDSSAVSVIPDKYYNSLHSSETPPSVDHVATNMGLKRPNSGSLESKRSIMRSI